jgi:hypothetical protein
MPTTPRPELFADVATQFERMEQPLNLAWMKARAVKLDELQALSQQLAVIIRGYLALPPRDRVAFISQGIFARQPAVEKSAGSCGP